tara:strand:- start:19616 stop:19897 length:282 start_codon:yes stop_codon:yes gene_type:complete
MGYLKMTLKTGEVKTIAADNIKLILDGDGNDVLDLVYVGDTAKVAITVANDSERNSVKEAVAAALVKYQGNQEGPAIEANGGFDINDVAAPGA